ncbi:MAG: RloB family protein, partial [Anaerolineaceae bacterium]
GRPYMQRSVNTLNIRQRFLIVCEGEKTEPNYFKCFRGPFIVVDAMGIGANTKSLVEQAIELKAKDDYDQIWCVFDKDDNSVSQFNEAIKLARRNHIKIAYSNQSFELWYVLHFCLMRSAITRSDYKKHLNKKLGHTYKKNCETIYSELHELQKDAIRNAKLLLTEYTPRRPAVDDPSTTVHELVEQLNKYSNNC